jgi:hypothetical protein
VVTFLSAKVQTSSVYLHRRAAFAIQHFIKKASLSPPAKSAAFGYCSASKSLHQNCLLAN